MCQPIARANPRCIDRVPERIDPVERFVPIRARGLLVHAPPK
jgi:hypothetical protein